MTTRTKTKWISTTVILVLALVIGVPVAGAEQRSSAERAEFRNSGDTILNSSPCLRPKAPQ